MEINETGSVSNFLLINSSLKWNFNRLKKLGGIKARFIPLHTRNSCMVIHRGISLQYTSFRIAMQNNLFTISKEICDTKKYLIKVGHDLTGLIVHYCLKPMS